MLRAIWKSQKKYIEAIAKSPNDMTPWLQVQYDNPNGFTHLFVGDEVEILEETSCGLMVTKLSNGQKAIIPNKSILRKKKMNVALID